MQASERTRWSLVFTLLIGSALAIRIALAAVGPAGPTWVDGAQYWSIARNLAASGSYTNSVPEPPGDHPYADLGPTSFWLPGYPLLLAAVVLVFGELPRAVYGVQALLSTLTVALVGDLGRRLAGWPTGVATAAFVAVSPLQLLQVARFGSEGLAALVLALQCWLLHGVLESLRADRVASWREIGLWIVSAFGVLVRSVFAPIAVVVVAWVGVARLRRRRYREAAAGLGAATLVGVLVLAPWFTRNLGLWGELVYNTKAGINLRIGFNPFADGRYATRGVPRLERSTTDELTRDRLLRDQALAWIRENPGAAAALAGRKLLLFWSPFHEQHPLASLRGAVVFAWSCLLFAAAAWGAFLALSRDRGRFAPLLVLVLVYGAFHATAFGAVRFRIPLGVVLALFAGYGLVGLVEAARALRE